MGSTSLRHVNPVAAEKPARFDLKQAYLACDACVAPAVGTSHLQAALGAASILADQELGNAGQPGVAPAFDMQPLALWCGSSLGLQQQILGQSELKRASH